MYSGDTELACAVDVVMVWAKRIYILIIKVNKFLFVVAMFCKRNGKHVLRVSIELYKHSWKFGRTRKSCGNTRLWLVFPQHFSLLLFSNNNNSNNNMVKKMKERGGWEKKLKHSKTDQDAPNTMKLHLRPHVTAHT